MANKNTEARIREARLIVARPEQVLIELEKYGAESRAFGGDKQLERSLFARSEPLIDLGLARYSKEKDVVAALYQKSHAKPADHLQERYLRGLRIACLSNEVVETPPFSLAFPEDVLGTEEFERLITEGDGEELAALLSNPNVSYKILEALYKNEGLFASLSDERRRGLVYLSIDNPRLTMHQHSVDGPDPVHMWIHKGIIVMLACAPTTEPWLNVLRDLLYQLDPGNLCSPDEAITPILDRWVQVPVAEEGLFKDGYYTALPTRDEFRCLVSAMYGCHYHYSFGKDAKFTSNILGSPDSPDVVLRCTFYGRAQLTEKEMTAGFARDGDVYLLAVLCNDSVYHNPSLRKLLEGEQLGGDLRYVYQRRCEQIHKRRPSFDPRPVSDWLIEDALPENKELTIVKQLETTVAGVANTFKSVQTWIVWGFVVLGALVLYKGH